MNNISSERTTATVCQKKDVERTHLSLYPVYERHIFAPGDRGRRRQEDAFEQHIFLIVLVRGKGGERTAQKYIRNVAPVINLDPPPDSPPTRMLSTWTRTVLLLYMANELQGFVPAPAGLYSARPVCPTGGRIALRVHVHREEDSKTDLLIKLVETKLDFNDVASKVEGAKHMIECKKSELESDVASKVESAIVTIWTLEGKKREVESEMVSKLEGAKHMIEGKKREMESELSSAAEQMFMRFDAFRNKVAAEEENAKRSFERFDLFMKKSESESADQ